MTILYTIRVVPGVLFLGLYGEFILFRKPFLNKILQLVHHLRDVFRMFFLCFLIYFFFLFRSFWWGVLNRILAADLINNQGDFMAENSCFYSKILWKYNFKTVYTKRPIKNTFYHKLRKLIFEVFFYFEFSYTVLLFLMSIFLVQRRLSDELFFLPAQKYFSAQKTGFIFLFGR